MALPVEEVRRLLDACWKAKAITELMPPLPRGFKPRYVHVVDAIWHINEAGGSQSTPRARVGDVSAFLGVTTPSITKLVGEMAELGLVTKHASDADRRAVTLALTERGLEIRRVYVEDYHAHLSQLLGDLSVDQCEAAVATIVQTLQLMREDAARQGVPMPKSVAAFDSASTIMPALHESDSRKEHAA